MQQAPASRWVRRHRHHGNDAHASTKIDGVSGAIDAGRVGPSRIAAAQEDETSENIGADAVDAMPENLRALLACGMESIKATRSVSHTAVNDVAELGSLMAQQGLFPRSKLASAQQLILENSLTSSFNRVLKGGARHVRGIFGHAQDLGLFDALRRELGRGDRAWSRGTKGSARIKYSVPGFNGCGLLDGEIVHDLCGEELPAFSFALRSLSDCVNADVLSWWVNIYEEGGVGLGFHQDHQNNNQGLRWGRIFDVTAGVSFGACRELTFRHAQTGREFNFPQENGDIFAFDTQTDYEFLHGIYRTKELCGPRISVIMVGKQRNSFEETAL